MRSRPGKVRLRTSAENILASGILLPDPAPATLLELAGIFGNRRPVEIEIGPGKGAFLLRRAAERPELNLLGIEWVRPYALYAADRALRAGLGNVRLLCADARDVFETLLAEACIWRVHLYFPDPWPKRRHRGRRLVTARFLAGVRRVLQPGGWVGIVTDHEDYFRQIGRALAATNGLKELPFVPPGDDIGWLVGSNFERKYAGAGKRFHGIAALRLG